MLRRADKQVERGLGSAKVSLFAVISGLSGCFLPMAFVKTFRRTAIMAQLPGIQRVAKRMVLLRETGRLGVRNSLYGKAKTPVLKGRETGVAASKGHL